MSTKALRKIQIGQETTAGSEANASTVWRGEGSLKDSRERVFPPEDVGLLAPTTRSYVPKLGAAITLADTPMTFEQFPLLLAACLEGTVTGVADGPGGGKIYQYDFPATAAQTLKTLTVEGGDDQREDVVTYCFAEQVSIKGASGESWQMGGTLQGWQAADGTFTAAIAIPTVEEALFGKSKLYIDASAGTIGTTQKTTTFLGFELTIPSGWKAMYTGDGNLYFSSIDFAGHKGDEITGTLTLKHDTAGEAEYVAARAGTLRLIRVLIEGTALSTAGSAYTNKTIRIDLAIIYTEVPELDDMEGIDTIALPFKVVYSSTDARFGQIIAVNSLAALT